MWQKLVSEIIIGGLQKLFSFIVGSVTDAMRTKKYKEVHERLSAIELELRSKSRITKHEAASIARKLNDIRSKL